jgi:hypothetical protein
VNDAPKVPNALRDLPTRQDDEVAMRILEGRALSRSDTNIHLAVPTGLLAIPLDNIVKVTPVAGTKGIVRILVRDPEAARPLLRVSPRSATGSSGGGVVAAVRGELIGSGILGPGVSTCDYYDTPTVTGEEGYDASDDEEAVCQNDDEVSPFSL